MTVGKCSFAFKFSNVQFSRVMLKREKDEKILLSLSTQSTLSLSFQHIFSHLSLSLAFFLSHCFQCAVDVLENFR